MGFLRIRVLSSHDTQVAMSCGLKALAVFRQDQPVSLTGTQFRASSEYPGHEAMKLLLPRIAAGGGAKIFTSQVSTRDLAVAKRRIQAIGGRKLDLAVVVYSHQIDQGIVPILKDVDTVLFWTWESSELKKLEANFRRLQEILPGKKVILGCYLWDFSLPTRTIPIELMEHQCELGLKWLRAGEIEGIIFLGSNIMDKHLKAVGVDARMDRPGRRGKTQMTARDTMMNSITDGSRRYLSNGRRVRLRACGLLLREPAFRERVYGQLGAK